MKRPSSTGYGEKGFYASNEYYVTKRALTGNRKGRTACAMKTTYDSKSSRAPCPMKTPEEPKKLRPG
jgi:hypothetical protein